MRDEEERPSACHVLTTADTKITKGWNADHLESDAALALDGRALTE
jgi:hypothetical protein